MENQKITCYKCGTAMNPQREDHLYKSSGLPNVIIQQIRINWCFNCDAYEIELTNINGLHKKLAEILSQKPQRLTSKEIRFLRSYLGWSREDFSKQFGVETETVVRWETGSLPMNLLAEHLLRFCISLKKPENLPTDETNGETTPELQPIQATFHIGEVLHKTPLDQFLSEPGPKPEEETTPEIIMLRCGEDLQWRLAEETRPSAEQKQSKPESSVPIHNHP